jgi:hypothetical protein
VEEGSGKLVSYSFEFGLSAVLPRKKSVFIDAPLKILKNNNAIRFGFTFLKEPARNKIESYVEQIILSFRLSDIPSEK